MPVLLRWSLCTLCLWLVAQALLARPAQAADRRVVVLAVGSNNGLDSEYPLRFAVQDAERFAQVMTELGDVRHEDVHLLPNPSRSTFLEALSQVRARELAELSLVVYFSGHGSTLALHLEREQLNLSELYAAMNAVPAQYRLLLVDACRGEARKGFQAGADPFDVGIGGSAGGLVAIHSTGLGEISVESNELRAGVFSHLFVSGLRGPADTNHDNAISVSEAYDYARVHRLDWGSPSPQMDEADASTRAMTLTHLNAPHSLLVLPPGADSYRIYAVGSSTELVRAWGSPTLSTRVALPGDHFVVYRGTGASRHVAEVTIPFGGTAMVEPGDFRARPEGTVKGWFSDDGEGGRVRAHDVGVATGARIDSSGRIGPAAVVSYAYGLSGLAPALSLGASRLSLENEANWGERTQLQLSAGVRYAQFFESFSASVEVAAVANLVRQELVSRETDSSGARPIDHSSAVGYGVAAGAALSLPLLSWLNTDVGVSGSVTPFAQKKTGTEGQGFELDAGLMLTLGLSANL